MTTNSKAVFREIQTQLNNNDPEETQAIALAIMSKYYGLTLTDILSGQEIERLDITDCIARLNRHEPLQYIFEEANFFGRKFMVNPSVLIPRPETELLIQEALKLKWRRPRILDIGTGSGCIAVTLSLEIPDSKVCAIDISDNALQVAKANARKFDANVGFIRADFLKAEIELDAIDIIVSNPPYVRESEMKTMDKNVLNYEPHLALFVPDNDPLLFYEAIATRGKILLNSFGKVLVEINGQFGIEVKQLFEEHGYTSVEIIKDMDDKDRIIVAGR